MSTIPVAPNPQPQPQAQAPSMVDVFSPEGVKGQVPMTNVGDYYRLGFKPAVRVTSPEGTGGWLPSTLVHDYMTNKGFKLGPPDQQNIPEDYTSRPELSSSGLNTVRAANDARPLWRKVLGLPSTDPAAQTAEASVAPGIQQSIQGQLGETYHTESAPLRGAGTAAKGIAVDMPKAIYHAVADAPKNPEEQQMEALSGRGGLAGKRLISDPMTAERQKATQDFSQGHTSEGISHSVAGSIPLIGPFAAHSGEAIGQDPVAGISELGVNLAFPKVAGEAIKGIKGLPVVKNAMNAASEAADASAKADLGKVLAPTKQTTKFIAKEKVIPGMQDRGIVARSSSALQDRAQANIADLGQKIDDAYDAMPQQQRIPTQPILNDLENYKGQFSKTVSDGQGGTRNVILDQGSLDRIGETQDMIEQYGDSIDPSDMRELRQYLDEQVTRAKGYQGKTLAEGQKVDVQRVAANSIRSQLAQSVPGLSDLNSEFSFWKNLNDVLEETAKRRTGQQGGGLGRKIASGTGTVVGAKIGGPAGALIGNQVGDYLSRLTNSTAWNTLKAATKTKLANALASRNPEAINVAVQDAQQEASQPSFIRGRLNAAPTIIPAPADTSGPVPFNAPPVAATTRAQRMGLLLPESTEPIPLPSSTAATSQEGVLRPGKIIARDPSSGQAKTFFTTGSQEQAGPTQYQMGRPSFLKNITDQRLSENSALRKRVADMTPEERSQALLTSEKTGLPNYRAFQESGPEAGPHVGYADMDNFKSYNNALGHDGVDQAVLPAIGDTFRNAAQKHGVNVFHRSGDEFLFRSDDPTAISNAVDDVNQQLANTTFEFKTPDGRILTKKGTGLSHGIGPDENAAELSAQQDKQSRAAQGLRTERPEAEAVQGLDTRGSTGKQASPGDNAERKAVPPASAIDGQNPVRPSFLRPKKKGGK